MMAKLTMTEILEKPRPRHDIERIELQDRLSAIDRDPVALQELIKELYGSGTENPHMLYFAATHLTSLSYLDRQNEDGDQLLPTTDEAARGFATYTRLLSMLTEERNSPMYAENDRIRRRLSGMREELAFHTVLAYATSQGGDFVALPSPAELDFSGAEEASDLRIFFPDGGPPSLDVQVTTNPEEKYAKGQNYHPRIPILSMSAALGDPERAAQVRILLSNIGSREESMSGRIKLRRRERITLLDAAASILQSAQVWNR